MNSSISNQSLSRRQLLQAAAMIAAGSLLPAAFAADPTDKPLEKSGAIAWNRTLLLIELRGGNDGLNTVIPFADPAYAKLRPTLAIPTAEVLRVDRQAPIGLHPALKNLAKSWRDSDAAWVLGVGYPQPNRSHFRSIDIWNGGSKADELAPDGWLARLLKQADAKTPAERWADALVLGYGSTVAHGGLGPLEGDGLRRVVMDAPDEFIARAKHVGGVEASAAANATVARIIAARADLAATATALEKIQAAPFTPPTPFPTSGFGQQLAVCARLLAGGLRVPAVKLTLDGFDTHAGQLPRHQALLTELGDGLAALKAALIQAKCWDRVLVMTYSEFGRRAAENGSAGTDHGAAAPHLLMGGKVAGGFVGAQPGLRQLDDGDQIFSTDFRRLYATIAQDWWGWKQPFLSQRGFASLGCIRN